MKNETEPWQVTLFRHASKRVPAYGKFLSEQSVSADGVRPTDFVDLPIVTKKNYLDCYPLSELLLDGSFDDADLISTSSGSSGDPFYWPRGEVAGSESAVQHEFILDHFDTRNRETLCVLAYAMGTWIAGTYTMDALRRLKREGHRLTVITPGIDVDENVRILDRLAPQFGQTIIFGYPPLVDEILTAAARKDLDFSNSRVRLVFAGESVTEDWRSRMERMIGVDESETGSLLIYGTADAGVVGFETSRSRAIRLMAAEDPLLHAELFPGVGYLPTLVEFDSDLRWIEAVDGEIVFTARNSLPLIRYAIGDFGAVVPSEVMEETLTKFGYEIPPGTRRPFVAVYGRPEIATTFFSLNIYPENVKPGLDHSSFDLHLTGRFVISTEQPSLERRPFLALQVELTQGVAPSAELAGHVARKVVESMCSTNAEYRRLHLELGDDAEPMVELFPNGSPQFAVAVKHRWVKDQ